MCFSKPDPPKPLPPAPTPVNIGENEAAKESREQSRKRQRAASGYQQNILTGDSGSALGSVSSKQLLGQ